MQGGFPKGSQKVIRFSMGILGYFRSTEQPEPRPGVLYVVATPIGNLGDLSPRAKNLLSKVSVIACEDTRHSGQLLKKLKIKSNLLSFHQHNTRAKIPKIIEFNIEGGEKIKIQILTALNE